MLPVNSTPTVGPKCVFFVDDSPELTRTYQEILEIEGYRVFVAESGSEALELLGRIAPPDLLFVDCLMHKMSGAQFLRELATRYPQIYQSTPIVGLSGLFRESPVLEEMKTLVGRMAEKPNSLEDILRLVRENIR